MRLPRPPCAMLWGMVIDESRCEECQGMAGSYLDPMQEPEYCQCCEQVLCERCWFASHVVALF